MPMNASQRVFKREPLQVRAVAHLQLILVGRVGLQVEADKCRFIRN